MILMFCLHECFFPMVNAHLRMLSYLYRFLISLVELIGAACGVCHSDLHVMKGELPFASPCVVGHEITGEVVEHGALTDSKVIERFNI